MSSPCARLLVIGLDCADPQLLLRWADSGDLPVIRSLRERGTWGPLASPPGLADDGTWASFYTGVSPARHGRYFFHAIEPGRYRTPFWQTQHLLHRPFWESLSAAGKRIAILDVPKCPLAEDINGVHLTDWRVHGRDRKTASQPPEIAETLGSRYGEDRTDCLDRRPWLCNEMELPPESYDEFLEALAQSVDDKLAFSSELLAREAWDLFLVVFKEAHCVSHKLWHLLDQAHPAHSARLAERYENAIKNVYMRLDRAIGRLIEIAAPTDVIVFSDLGMASNYTGNPLLETVLERLEQRWLSPAGRIHRRLRTLALSSLRRFDKHHDSWARGGRLFYAVPNGEQSGAIRLNLAGRERWGMVEPGAGCDALSEYLVEALSELVDPDSGMPIVEEILRTPQVYQGPHADRLPDLLVVWRRERPILAAASRLIGEVRVPELKLRTGGHVAGGLYVMASRSAPRHASPVPASITDLAPTIAALLGHPLAGVDGRPLVATAQRDAGHSHPSGPAAPDNAKTAAKPRAHRSSR